MLGTPGYMAPEQARGEVERIDERADVYALGAHPLLPADGRPPAPIRRASRRAAGTPACPGRSSRICLKALAAEPAARYAASQALAADVSALPRRAARAGAPREARSSGPAARPPLPDADPRWSRAYLAMRVALIWR